MLVDLLGFCLMSIGSCGGRHMVTADLLLGRLFRRCGLGSVPHSRAVAALKCSSNNEPQLQLLAMYVTAVCDTPLPEHTL